MWAGEARADRRPENGRRPVTDAVIASVLSVLHSIFLRSLFVTLLADLADAGSLTRRPKDP